MGEHGRHHPAAATLPRLWTVIQVSTKVIEFLRRFPDCGLLGKTVAARAFEKSLLKRRHQMALHPDHRWAYGKNPVPLDGGADGSRKRNTSPGERAAAAAMELIPDATEEYTIPALSPALTVHLPMKQQLQ